MKFVKLYKTIKRRFPVKSLSFSAIYYNIIFTKKKYNGIRIAF